MDSLKGHLKAFAGWKLIPIILGLAVLAAAGGCIENPWLTPTPTPTPAPLPMVEIPLSIPGINPGAVARDSIGNILVPSPGEKMTVITTPEGALNIVIPVVAPRGVTLSSFSDPLTGVILSDDGLVIPIRDGAGKVNMTLLATVRPLTGTGTTAQGKIEKLELETTPISANLSRWDTRVGLVSFQAKAELKSLPEGAAFRIVLAKAPNPATMNAFTLAATRVRNRLRDIAFVVEVTKMNLLDGKDLGAGTVTFRVGRQWADTHGTGNIAAIVLADDGSVELLLTQFTGYLTEGEATFVAQTKRGVSTFGLVALESTAPTPTPTPAFYKLELTGYPAEYGNISVEPASPTSQYLEGTTLVLRAYPIQGNKFERWEGGATSTLSRVEVVMDSNKTVTAIFSKLTFEIIVDSIPRNGGTVEVSPYLSEYDYGTRITLSAQVAPGFLFRSWSGDVSGNANPVTIIVDGPKTITANFVVIRYSFNTLVTPPGAGNVSPPSGAADTGTQISLFATPAEGYIFSSWSGNVPTGAADNPINITLDRDRNIVANFTRAQYTLSTGIFPGAGGNVSPASGTFEYGRTVTLTAIPNQEYLFNGWGGDISGSENPKTITITKNTRVEVSFVAVRYTLNVNVFPFEGGFVAPTTSGVFPSGTIVNLQARPSPGYVFIGWSGDAFTASPFISVQMNRNTFLTANFRFVPTPTPVPPT